MNKLTKATIAGAAGVALLLGGAGTFATWNATAPISGGTIVAGSLVVGTAATGSWSVAHLTPGSSTYGTSAATTLAAYKASPGDQLTYTTTVPITVSGTNLVATLGLASGSIVATPPTSGSMPAVNTAFVKYLALNTVVAMSGTGISGTAPNYVINGSSASPITATVTATITFSSGAASTENTSMLGSVDLSGMALSLVQNS